jgi:MFS superfamily sulfate permease-like transporter
LSEIFPRLLVKGLQLGLGMMMIRSGIKLVLCHPNVITFVTYSAHAGHGGGVAGLVPSGHEFWSALPLLALPQLPLTLGNSVIATRDCAIKYFGAAGERATAGRLAATIGLGNLAAGITGGMPMCHGAGGMTAHYHFGARTGAAGVMLGSIFLVGGFFCGQSLTHLLSSMPAWILGALLGYVGIRHAMLAKEAFAKPANLVVVVSMGAVGYFQGNLLAALIIGLAIKLLLQYALAWRGKSSSRDLN